LVRDIKELFGKQEEQQMELQFIEKPPVITVMGHVGHGKTTLLDAIKNTKVAEQEQGSITQHIGAYEVNVKGKKVVFIDTPGHEAFTAMRRRGVMITDIVVLVVAGNEGVMPQTKEAIAHAKEANVPIVVAINKVDLPDANTSKVKQQLSEFGLIPEEWSGKTIFVEISAKTNKGINTLLEMLLLEAEMLELKAAINKRARGIIIEAKLDKGRGPVATVILQEGVMRVGDAFVCGSTYGRVKAMIDSNNNRLKEVLAGIPVEILGFSYVPQAGDELYKVKNEKIARFIIEKKQRDRKVNQLAIPIQSLTLKELSQRVAKSSLKELKLIIKTDTWGSVEVIKETVSKLSTETVKVNILYAGVGNVNESDVILASASEAIIIAFHLEPPQEIIKLAEEEHIEIGKYYVIYDIIEEVKATLEGLLEPEYEEIKLGEAEVRELFIIKVNNKKVRVGGCYVKEGKLMRNETVRIIRNNQEIGTSKIISLRRFKEDAKEVAAGFECGLILSDGIELQKGDIIKLYRIVTKKRVIN